MKEKAYASHDTTNTSNVLNYVSSCQVHIYMKIGFDFAAWMWTLHTYGLHVGLHPLRFLVFIQFWILGGGHAKLYIRRYPPAMDTYRNPTWNQKKKTKRKMKKNHPRQKQQQKNHSAYYIVRWCTCRVTLYLPIDWVKQWLCLEPIAKPKRLHQMYGVLIFWIVLRRCFMLSSASPPARAHSSDCIALRCI